MVREKRYRQRILDILLSEKKLGNPFPRDFSKSNKNQSIKRRYFNIIEASNPEDRKFESIYLNPQRTAEEFKLHLKNENIGHKKICLITTMLKYLLMPSLFSPRKQIIQLQMQKLEQRSKRSTSQPMLRSPILVYLQIQQQNSTHPRNKQQVQQLSQPPNLYEHLETDQTFLTNNYIYGNSHY